MRKFLGLLFGLTLVILATGSVAAKSQRADGNEASQDFAAALSGRAEIPANASPATGEAEYELSEDGTQLFFQLEYEDITGKAFMAHIHIGSPKINGPIVLWLCGGPTGRTCPEKAGEVKGVATAKDVVGPLMKAPAPLKALIAEMRAGNTYTNVHSLPNFPGGEIRGQNIPE